MRPPSTLHLVALLLALSGLAVTVWVVADGDLVQDPSRAWRPVDPSEAPTAPK